jgi:hypothetical protein
VVVGAANIALDFCDEPNDGEQADDSAANGDYRENGDG